MKTSISKAAAPKVSALALAFSAMIPALASELRSHFPGLPPVLEKVYGSAKLEVRLAASGRATLYKGPLGRKLVIEAPNRDTAALAFAGLVLSEMARNDKNPNTMARMLKSRIQGLAARRLIEPSYENGDRLGLLWWRLRTEPRQALSGGVRRGDRILYITRTGVALPVARTKPTFLTDHASLGVRTYGGDPEADYVMNPGSNAVESRLVDRFIPTGKLQNSVRVFNLWQWLDGQRENVSLDIESVAVRITPLQAEFLDTLKEEIEFPRWGNFNMLINNCSNGTMDLLTALLPITENPSRDFDPTPVRFPREVMRSAERHFEVIDRKSFPVKKRSLDQLNFVAEPLVGVPPAQTQTYAEYLAWERSF